MHELIHTTQDEPARKITAGRAGRRLGSLFSIRQRNKICTADTFTAGRFSSRGRHWPAA
jgi:hypothetical protein